MPIRRTLILWLLVVVVAVAGGMAHAGSTPRKGSEPATIRFAKAGDEPILFDLKNLAGDSVKLQDYLGKNAVMLVFWSLFCGPCQKELPLVNEVYDKYAPKGLKVFAINLDSDKRAKAVKKYMKKKGFNFEVLWEKIEGVNYLTADAYGVQGTPTTVVIGIDGKVSYAHVGQDTIEKIEAVAIKALGI